MRKQRNYSLKLSMTNIRNFGFSNNGNKIYEIRIKNGQIKADILNYGCTLRRLFVPDKNGNEIDVVLGCDSIDDYEKQNAYLGAVIGRVANRINGGEFKLDGSIYYLAVNNSPNHLHGGLKGFDKQIWEIADFAESYVKFSYTSKSGEEGYPGSLKTEIKYSLTQNNELTIEYKAIPSERTPINLTNHSYFNLNGKGSILEHRLKINSDSFLAINENSIPSDIIEVEQDPAFDFRKDTLISENINKESEQIKAGNGFDHCYILNGDINTSSAELYSEKSGIAMSCYTDMPGAQLYTANYLSRVKGKNGNFYSPREAVCLETQYYPDSVNREDFPSIIFDKNDVYNKKTIYSFSVR